MTRPNVYEAKNFREFLRDFYEYQKHSAVGFSYRAFSQAAGFKSPNFIKLVIDGKRNLTLDSIRKISVACKFSNGECDFFRQLVQLHQAENPSDKTRAVREMFRSQIFRDLYPLREAELDYYENWASIPIREMVASPLFKENHTWISKKLRGKASPDQVGHAIESMLKLGLLVRDENGRLAQANRNVSTGNEAQSAAVILFHQQMIGMAAQSITEIKRHQREISSSTVLISEKTFHHLKELMQNFRKALIAEAESGEAVGAAVYQVNLQLFPVTEPLDLNPAQEPKCKSA